MKNHFSLQLFFLVALFAGLSPGAKAQCNAAFSDSLTGPYQVSLYNSSDTAPSMVYYWSMPGGNPSADTTYSVVTTVFTSYNSTTPQTICLITLDTLTMCSDTTCQTVYPNAYLFANAFTLSNSSCGLCNGSAWVSYGGGQPPHTMLWSNGATSDTVTGLCAGMYTVTVTDQYGTSSVDSFVTIGSSDSITASISNGNPTPCPGTPVTLQASVSNGTAPYTYSWNTGEGSQAIAVNSSGAYSVTVSDANGCTATATTSVNYLPSFTTSISTNDETCPGCCDGSAAVAATGGSGVFSYNWSTGSTNDSTSALCAGTYSVTVTDDSSGCTVIEDSIFIGTQSSCTSSVEGSLSPATEAILYLIKESSGVLSLVDSMDVDSGYYFFGNLCPGTYYVKAALRPVSSMYGYYLPTYYAYSALWGNATAVIVNGAVDSIDINLLAGTNLGGPGFVGGLISQGANRGEGDPVAGAQVFLADGNGNMLTTTTSDANGNYAFDGLPEGGYQVYADLLNYIPYPHVLTVSTSNATFNSMDFIVEGGVVKPVPPVGIGPVPGEEAATVYPNPAGDRLVVDGTELRSATLYNLVGQQIMQQEVKRTPVLELYLGNIAPGQYLLEVVTTSGIQRQTIVKE